MMIGEFDYRDSFLTDIADGDIRYPRSIMVLVIFIFFIIIMPVMVMNLMVSKKFVFPLYVIIELLNLQLLVTKFCL